MTTDVLIIGGGLAGLACANRLNQQGISNIILEADENVGGRVRTDRFDGFLLDHGFQVFSTAYPEAKRIFNYDSLKLHTFYPGALIRFDGSFHLISDPFRHPIHALRSLGNPIGTLTDKIRVARWRRRALAGPIQGLFQRPETTTIDHLQSMGFSQSMIDRFFRPFLSGIFMDEELTTSSRVTDFVFRMFASGDIAIPEEGIGALSQQLAQQLGAGQIRKGEKVIKVEGTTVTLETGERLQTRYIVIATNGPAATQLVPEFVSRPYHQATSLYFSAPQPPMTGPYLILNGERHGVINSVCVLTEVTRSYAPPGQHLVSVTTHGNAKPNLENIETAARSQCTEWFGRQVHTWRHLRTYHVQCAQPIQFPPFQLGTASNSKLRDGLYISGDHRSTATFDGAISSGRQTAEEILNELKT